MENKIKQIEELLESKKAYEKELRTMGEERKLDSFEYTEWCKANAR